MRCAHGQAVRERAGSVDDAHTGGLRGRRAMDEGEGLQACGHHGLPQQMANNSRVDGVHGGERRLRRM